MDLRHAVDIGAHIHAEVCHMGGVVLDDEQVGMLAFELLVDSQNDIHDLRHHRAHQLQIPLFQSLAHNRMIGVGEGLLGNLEALLKIHTLRHQQADQFGNGHCRVGIVQLDTVEVSKMAHICAVGGFIHPEHILQRGRRQHILLLDTQALALPSGIVGVEHPGDILSLVLLRQCPEVILIVKGIEVQFFLCFTLPQTQSINILRAVANDRHIVRHGQDRMVGEFHLDGMVIPAVGPGIAKLCPIVGIFLLRAVGIKALLEQAKPIPQTVTGQGHINAGGRI